MTLHQRSRALSGTLAATVACALVAFAPGIAPAAPGADQLVGQPVLIGAGHLHGQSEGFFFPGELPCEGCPTIPVEIEQGTNIEFRGMDEEVHQVTAKKKRAGRPLFKSAPVKDGATTLVLTEGLKPGSYEFFCFFHPEMRGVLEVTG